MLTCSPETAALLAQSESTECRIEWSIGYGTGNGEWHPISERTALRTWIDDGNRRHGPGTHWIMTR